MTGYARMPGQSRAQRVIAVEQLQVGPRRGRELASAPEPQAVDGRFAALLACAVDRMIMQQHLQFIHPGKPPGGIRTGRQKGIDVLPGHP